MITTGVAEIPLAQLRELESLARRTVDAEQLVVEERRKSDEAYRIAIAVLLAVGGTVNISRQELHRSAYDPSGFEVVWQTHAGMYDPLGNDLSFSVRRKEPGE